MKIWNIFRREEVDQVSTPPPRVSSGAYQQNVVHVNSKERAMKIASVYRAVNLIASGVAVLTLEYKRKDMARNYFKLYDTGAGARVNYLIQVQPNERMNAFTFFKNVVAQVLLLGNAIIVPKRNMYGEVTELVLVKGGSTAYDEYSNRYTVYDETNKIGGTYEAKDIIHIKNTCNDGGYWGLSTIHYAAVTLGIAATADKETEKRFATGGRWKAILQNDHTVKGFGEAPDEEMESMAEDIQASLNNGDDIISVRGDGKLTPISMTSSDMQFLESRKFTIREISRFFNVPPSKLMDDTNSNYKSTEMSNIQFYSEALQPIVTEIEREFNAKLVGAANWGDYRFNFDVQKIYALDLDSLAKWNKARLESGQVTVNDLRREVDKEPVEGGDEVYLSVNFAPLGSAKLNGETKAPEKGGQE